MECCDCHQIASSYEVTMEISLEIPKSEDAIDLYKCLDLYTAEEVIQKSCSNCGGNVFFILYSIKYRNQLKKHFFQLYLLFYVFILLYK